ncbi:MAG: hypothetical protein LBE34_07815 [Flavobacteriaceae bacterium]|jgi:hypothetical protein|nr:hypothetical protein [Flavobacteriaceae bacterium]
MKKCLLCTNNDASSQRSHIIPKFFREDIYEVVDGRISISLLYVKKKTIKNTQDLVVQDYLLCEQCESELSYFETISSRILKNIYSNESNNYFTITSSDFNIDNIILNRNSEIFNLFFLSLIWRISVSKYFESFKLNSSVENEIRNLLLNNFKYDKKKDISNKEDVLFKGFEYVLFKPKSKSTSCRGGITAYRGSDSIYVIDLPFISVFIYLNKAIDNILALKRISIKSIQGLQLLSMPDDCYNEFNKNKIKQRL